MPYKPTGRPPGRPRHPEPLTPAEQRVLQHLRDGLPNTEIATRLGVSPDAVKYHVSNMLGKLGFESREQLATWREPSVSRRAWGGLVGLGWKAAIVGGAAVVGVVALVVALVAFRGGSEEDRFDGELLTGVISVGMNGEPADGPSSNPSISGDGRLVAFESEATNLVPGDTNGVADIFVFDRLIGEMRRISNGMNGQEANGASHRPAISADGKWVAFDSEASNLVPGDVNGEFDRAVSLVPDSMRSQFEGNGPDALTWKSFASQWAGSDVFVVELSSGTMELISATTEGDLGNLGSFSPSISGDGGLVAFESTAPNLAGRVKAGGGPPIGAAAFPGTIGGEDVYLRDRTAKQTRRLSVAVDSGVDATRFASAAPVITRDGRHVAFVSREGRLVDGDRHGTTYYVWSDGPGIRQIPWPETPAGADGPLLGLQSARPAISQDGKLVVFGYSGSAPVRPRSEGLEVDGIFFHREGDHLPSLVPGTEKLGDSGLAMDPGGNTFVFPAVSSELLRLATYTVGADRFEYLPSSIVGEATIFPAISGDGEWVAAMGANFAASGPPRTQIVVFPR